MRCRAPGIMPDERSAQCKQPAPCEPLGGGNANRRGKHRCRVIGECPIKMSAETIGPRPSSAQRRGAKRQPFAYAAESRKMISRTTSGVPPFRRTGLSFRGNLLADLLG